MVILVGPSGAGKSSFLEKALQDIPGLVDTVTYTTRPMRANEREGQPYHFVSEDRFKELINQGFFVEWAHVHNRLYGTPKYQIEEAWKADKTVIMDVDVQGAKTFKKHYPQAVAVFIMPPSIEALRQRVVRRHGQPPEDLEIRMENALKEMDQARDFDIQIVNDNFETSYLQFKKIVEDLIRNR